VRRYTFENPPTGKAKMTRFTVFFAVLALALVMVTLPAGAGPPAGISPVCNPSWGTITIPVCV